MISISESSSDRMLETTFEASSKQNFWERSACNSRSASVVKMQECLICPNQVIGSQFCGIILLSNQRFLLFVVCVSAEDVPGEY